MDISLLSLPPLSPSSLSLLSHPPLSPSSGNDLARALNWGGGYSGEKVMQILLSVEDANTVELDRSSTNNDCGFQ